MTATADKVKTFRQLHNEPGTIYVPNPWDIGSAKMLANIGFKTLATTSGGFAWSIGKLDGGVERDEKIDHCRQLCAAVEVPISADLGAGFAENANAVAETVKMAANAGLAACSIEDAANPYFGGTYEFSDAVERISAAVEAARDATSDFMIIARCENFTRGPGDFDDTLKRLAAYDEAGADILYAPGITTEDQIKQVCAITKKPVNVLTGFRGFNLAPDELSALGVKRISLGTDLPRMAYGSMIKAAKEFLDSGQIIDNNVNARSSTIAKYLV